MPGVLLMRLGLVGYAVALPGLTDHWRHLRRAHITVRQSRHPLRIPVRAVRALPKFCHQRRADAGRSASGTVSSMWLNLERGLLAGGGSVGRDLDC